MTKPPAELDRDALRAKYRAERDKRIRADGNAQYIEVTGAFSHYVDDPYVDAPLARESLHDEVEVLVIGGGFGGLLAGARLREAGVDAGEIRIVEKGGDFGGTWYWNRYPGAMCDIESYIYLPLLEELGYVPKEKYTHAPEILDHSRNIGKHFGLYDNACFQTEVTDLTWDEDVERWIVSTNRGDAMRARFVISSSGPLHRAKLPGIPGIQDFTGHSFHTSRWDYAYTGGDPDGGLVNLADKRVAVIGTGATAVQVVPHVGEWAQHLYVFQRTPSSIDVRNNRDTDPEWARSLQPGWQKQRMENFNALVSGGFAEEDLVADGWTDIFRLLLTTGDLEAADFEKMNQIRARVDEIVEDPRTADALKPYYRQFCKRPCFHDEYLQTFNRPNVDLVDTNGQGVERITARGVVANGVEYEVDCIIFATGFEVGTSYQRRSGYTIHGVDGIELDAAWADGVRTLHSMHVDGFPNLFLVQNAQGGFTPNFPHNLEEMSRHFAYVIGELRARGATRVEASRAAVDEWVGVIRQFAPARSSFFEDCTPGYYNNEGQPGNGFFTGENGPYGGGPIAFYRILEKWRASGDLAGLEIN
ncbi:MAG TPA: NAD(P)/FAD-dependent oxidoreductase [Acidimicrobiales bacterium]|nr:NAD(P)/FAD-dependent oxidoreductase [Acidimicrobiales bacterium]